MEARATHSRGVHMDRYIETPLLSPSQHLQFCLQDPQATGGAPLKLRWRNKSHGDCVYLGSVSPSAPGEDAVLWSYQAQDPRKMTFSGVKIPGSVYWCVDVVAPRAIFPVPALAVVRGILFGYLLDESGLVWAVELVDVEGGVMRGGGLRNEDRASLEPIGFGEKLGGLKEIVFWGTCSGSLCVGGSSGGALSLELDVVHGERSPGGNLPVELWEGYIRRVITTVLQGGMLGPGLVSAVVIECGTGIQQEALALVYADGSIRVHDVVRNELLTVHNLGLEEGVEPAGVTYCQSESCLVIQLAGSTSGVTLLDVDLSGRRIKLVTRRSVHRRFSEGAVITTAIKWKGCMWLCLTRADFKSEMVLIDDGQSVNWVEDHPLFLRGQSEDDLDHQAALWHQAIEDALKDKQNELDLKNYTLDKIMTVGALSHEALKDTFRDFAINFSSEDWAAANSGRISDLLEAAASSVQTQNPAFDPIRCYCSVIQQYFIKWMCRHMPVKLALSSDQSTLLVVRAGCVMNVVRGMSPVEACIKHVRSVLENGTAELSDPLHYLIKAVLLLWKTCGSMFLDLCSTAILRGADASQDAIPSTVRAIMNPITNTDGERRGQETWNSQRRVLLLQLDDILKRISPNLNDTIQRLCDLDFSSRQTEDMDIDSTMSKAPMGLTSFVTNSLRQITFCRQHLLSGVAVVLGLGLSTTKVLMLDYELSSHSTQRLLGCWSRSTVLHGLCSIPAISTGMRVSTQGSTGVALPNKDESRCQGDAFISAAHAICIDFLEDESISERRMNTHFSSILDTVAKKFSHHTDGAQGSQNESRGFSIQLCDFAIMFFVKGQWQAVDFLGRVATSYKSDAAQNLVIILAKATRLWLLKNEPQKQEAEAQATEHITRSVERLQIDSNVDRDFESRVQKLRSSFTSARRISGELSTIITYLETMVFVLDYVNAHSAASQVAQVAIGMITEDTPNDDHKQLQRQLWEQVFHHCCACCNFALAFGGLSKNIAVTEECSAFNVKTLVCSMYKTGRIEELLSYPFSHMRFSAVVALEELGYSVCINDEPSPFEILCKWHYQATHYQKAAESLVAYARRIEKEAVSKPGAVKMIHASIVRAVLVLGLCDEHDCWVRDPQKVPNSRILGVSSLAELQREHAKLAAFIKVLDCTGKESCTGIPTCKWIVQELLKHEKFEYVLKIIPYLFKASDQSAARRNALRYIAAECVEQSKGKEGYGGESHSLPDSLFIRLKGWLEEYDIHNGGQELTLSVAEKILQTSKEMCLPQWLIETFRGRGCDKGNNAKNISPLIALLHRYGHLDLAVELLIDEARYAAHWLHMDNSLDPPEQYVPVHLIKVLRRDLLGRNYRGLLKELDQSLQILFQLQKRWN